jgi:hypothetical protein
MLLGRTPFFLLLAILLVCPFYVYKLIWLSGTRTTSGIAWFTGHTLQNDGSVSSHLVILFLANRDSITFEAGTNLGFKEGDPVPVRYQRTNPRDARVDTTVRIWGDTWVNSLLPALFLLILFLTPSRFDPLVPWDAKVRIGIRPFIKLVR